LSSIIRHHSSNSGISLSELLNYHDIDIVVLPSAWEETFCITAYEALEGGAKVMCLKGSGNLSDLAEINKDVIAFENIKLMNDEIQTMHDSKKIEKNYYLLKNNMNLLYAK